MIRISYANESLTLKANPQDISFAYNLNTSTTDTKAGRVVQILSTNISDLTVNSRIGASRGYQDEAFKRYYQLVQFCRRLMEYHAETNMPASFTFDELNYNMNVFLKSQTFTDNLQQVSYPYTLSFAVDEDVTGIATNNAMSSVFANIKSGVGFVPGKKGWHGGTT